MFCTFAMTIKSFNTCSCLFVMEVVAFIIHGSCCQTNSAVFMANFLLSKTTLHTTRAIRTFYLLYMDVLEEGFHFRDLPPSLLQGYFISLEKAQNRSESRLWSTKQSFLEPLQYLQQQFYPQTVFLSMIQNHLEIVILLRLQCLNEDHHHSFLTNYKGFCLINHRYIAILQLACSDSATGNLFLNMTCSHKVGGGKLTHWKLSNNMIAQAEIPLDLFIIWYTVLVGNNFFGKEPR